MKIKYPRTPHLPGSDAGSSDLRLSQGDIEQMFSGKEVVITEKMDGENTSIYRDCIHARSLDSCSHPSRDWVHALWGSLRWKLPEGYRVCGENLYAKHAIYYPELQSYFLGFSVWNQLYCLPWEDTVSLFIDWYIQPVPVLYQGVYQESVIKDLKSRVENSDDIEGFVVRLAQGFRYDDFGKSVAKFVREGHVQPDDVHWFNKQIITNGLVETSIK